MASKREPGIAGLVLENYRVFEQREEIRIGAFTLLAGENSAGKSSAMHPLLLLKQTLEAPLDPGPLLLDGENVRLTSADQLFSVGSRGPLRLGIRTTENHRLELTLQRGGRHGIDLEAMTWQGARGIATTIKASGRRRGKEVGRVRFLLGGKLPRLGETHVEYIPGRVSQVISRAIHVSGMRGSLGRTQPSAAVGDTFPGTFDRYVASIVEKWQSSSRGRLDDLNRDLQTLGVTWKVAVERRSDVALELKVGRLKKPRVGGAKDLISLADVGLGTAQVLPVLVALHAAEPNQLVFIEQPELHLHPNAQVALAGIIVAAVKRGVRVVVETHSSLLLLGVQTELARGKLASEDVCLHWFLRNTQTGATEIKTAEVDADGTFGNWPVDFDEVALKLQSAYMTAIERRRAASSR